MSVVPFTQSWENAKSFVGDRRIDLDTEAIYKDIYNNVYTKALPQVLEFDILKKEMTPVLMRGDYLTGTATTVDASTTIDFAGAASIPTYVGDGWKFKLTSGSDTDDLYEVSSRSSATRIILKRAFAGTGASSLTFVLYQDLMSLPSDFSRLTTNPRFWYRRGGSVNYVDFKEDGQFLTEQTATPGTPNECRLALADDSSGNPQLQFNAGWDDDTLIYGEYIKELSDLVEYTTGTVAVTNNSTTVTGTDTLWNTNASAGDYFRIDTDGNEWYRISTVVSDTSITLASVYRGSNKTGVKYTISDVPDIPDTWHNVITYGVAALGALHFDDHNGYQRWQSLSGIPEGVLLSLMKHESRTRYGTQRMNTIYQVSRTFQRNDRLARR